jgi:hypothetical protein
MPLAPFRTILPQTETGLVLYIPFEDGSSGQAISIANDYSIYGNHGTLKNFAFSGTSDWTTGKYGQALSFDGVDDYVEVSANVSLNYGSSFTIEVWFKTSLVAWRWLVTKLGGSWFGINNNGYLDWTKQAGIDYTSSKYVADGAWHHGVVTFNNGNLKLYADGVNVGNWSGVTLTVTSGKTYIGQRGDNVEFFNGLIDEVRIYNRALSEEEIKAHFRGTCIVPVR